MVQGGAEDLWNIPNSAKDKPTEKSNPTDTTTTKEKSMNTQEVVTTTDTRTSLGIYSMSAPSSAVSSTNIFGLETPHPTISETHNSSLATTKEQITNEAITSPARKPILVTGIPSGIRRQIDGKWVENENTYDDTMPRIPITTPHSVVKKKHLATRKIKNSIQSRANNTNSITKGKDSK